MRRRLQSRTAAQLLRSGLALSPLKMARITRIRRGSYGGGKVKVALSLPPKTAVDKLRFRKGECVIISQSSPLIDAVGEGSLLSLSDGRAVVGLEGASAWAVDDAQWARCTWRLDSGPNRVSYERRLRALVSLCSSRQPQPLHEMLLSGDVHSIGEWARRERRGVDLQE